MERRSQKKENGKIWVIKRIQSQSQIDVDVDTNDISKITCKRELEEGEWQKGKDRRRSWLRQGRQRQSIHAGCRRKPRQSL